MLLPITNSLVGLYTPKVLMDKILDFKWTTFLTTAVLNFYLKILIFELTTS
jgi:hypothetical protein